MSSEKWEAFIRNSVLRRVPEEDISSYSAILSEQYYLNGRRIARILFDCRTSICSFTDPIISRYLRTLVSGNCISINDILYSVLDEWTPGKDYPKEESRDSLASRLEADAVIIQELAIQASSRHHSTVDVRALFIGCSKLLSAIVPHVGKSNEGKERDAISLDPALSVVEAACLLFATLSVADSGVAVMLDEKDTELRSELTRLFAAAGPFLPMMSMELRQRLEDVLKGYSLGGKQEEKKPDDAHTATAPDAAQFEVNILDADNLRSRASIYVCLNAALGGTPRLDDASLMTFLMSRYNGDFVNMVIHLILASFDVLANGVHRSEPGQTMDIYHCFIANKLPLLVSYISRLTIEPLPLDACVTQAYSRIDPTVFPAFSSTFDLGNKEAPFADVRQEFLFSCALHELLPVSSIEGLLGESSMMTLPTHGKYVKSNIAQQLISNQKKADQLIEELELFEGNSGIIADAIVEVIQRLCRDKETMTLKRICLHLVRKPRRLDVVALFHNPASYLQPLCNVLDGWQWDEDQGESQPVYDEFGSILLLVLTAKHRYSLEPSDLGVTHASSFVLRLVEQIFVEKSLDQLDDTAKQHLGSWISALFIAEGLSDELTSSCSPQDFYLLVPTLFSQSIAACNAGKLSIDALKTGFEYLLEGFLLPSLLVALLWLSNHIRSEQENNARSSLQLLHALIKPTSGSFEAREIHQTIVSIVFEPIKQALHSPKNASGVPEIQSISKLLNSYNDFKRASSVSRNELDVWASIPGGLPATVQHAFQNLVFWDTNHMSTNPPSFTYKVFTVGIRIHGVMRVLQLCLEELKMQHASGSFDIALDVLFAIICASSISSPHVQQQAAARLGLQDAVRLEHTNLSKYLEAGENVIAEALVRLSHRLNNLSLVVLPQAMSDGDATATEVGPLPDDLENIDLTTMNMGGAAANASMTGDDTNIMQGNGSTDPNAANKDLIDQILESTNNATAAAAAAAGASSQQQQGQSTTANDSGTANGSLASAGSGGFGDLGMGDDMMFDLDSANLGLGSDFDLEMDGMF